MRKWLLTLLLFVALGAAEEGRAAYHLLNIRKWSAPDYTRVVLDLDGPPIYEIQSAANSAILVLYLSKLVLPRGSEEVPIEDRVIRKVKLDPGERARITFFLYQPARWKIFVLKPDSAKPDRLVIDVFKPSIETKEEVETPPSPGTKEQKAIPEKIEVSPPPTTPEELREKEAVPAKKAPPARGATPSKEVIPTKEVIPAKEAAPIRAAGQPAKLLEIRQWTAPDHTRVVIDLDAPPAYEILPPIAPLIYTLNLRGILLPKGGQEIPIGDQVIQKMKVEPVGGEEAKLTLFLVKPGRLDVFLLKPYLDKPDRLVIDVSRPDLEEKEKVERQVTRELKARKKRIVVLDPGHGGEDPGAIGPRGTKEKDIVLALAWSLQKVLDGTGEVRAFLTRRGDYFVPLHDRVKIAQEYGADLFISLHANGSRSRKTRGTSIYCLSLKGASDTATQLLAQKENASDLMGGISLASVQRDLDSILLDLEQTHSINESLQLGGLVLSELGRVNQVQFSQPRQAGFAVLKAHEFPSILVESAYITHPNEELLLRKKTFQGKLCQAITAAVKSFIPRLAVKEVKPVGGEEGKPRGKKGA